jgi:hypothetical protein
VRKVGISRQQGVRKRDGWIAALVVGGGALGLLTSGCVATKYQMVRDASTPMVPLTFSAGQENVAVSLRGVVVYNGPGSWKRDALWDEYVVTIENSGASPVTIEAPTLVDFESLGRRPGVDPWAVEKESQKEEERYRRNGIAFARSSAPRVLLMGANAAGTAAGGAVGTAAAAAATASIAALPVYYVVVWRVNHRHKQAVNAEFARRKLQLPLTIPAGESRTGSLFYPMAADPQSLRVPCSREGATSEVVLDLGELRGLHRTAPAAADALASRSQP